MANNYATPDAFLRVRGKVYCSKCGRLMMQDKYHLESHAGQCGLPDFETQQIINVESLLGYAFRIEDDILIFRGYSLATELNYGPSDVRLKASWEEVYSARFRRDGKVIKESGLYNADIWMGKLLEERRLRCLSPDEDADVIFKYFTNVPDICNFKMFLDIYRQRGYWQKNYDVREELELPLDETVKAIFRETEEENENIVHQWDLLYWNRNCDQTRKELTAVTGFEKFGEQFLMFDFNFSSQRIILSENFLAYSGERMDLSFLIENGKSYLDPNLDERGSREIVFLEYPQEGVIRQFARRYPALMLEQYLNSGGENPLVPLLAPYYDNRLELFSKAGLGALCNYFGKIKENFKTGVTVANVKEMLHLPLKFLKRVQGQINDDILETFPAYAAAYKYNPALLSVDSFENCYNSFLRDCFRLGDGFKCQVRPLNGISENEMLKTARYVFNLYSAADYEMYKDYLCACEMLDMWQLGKWPKNLKKAHDDMTDICLQHKDFFKRMRFDKAISNEDYSRLGTEIVMSAEPEDTIGSLQKKIWQNESYLVMLPKNAEDLSKESFALHHCVASYTNRVENGSTYILFLRKKQQPDKPFATMEVQPVGKSWTGVQNDKPCLIQLKGVNNTQVSADAQSFVRRWAKEKGVRIRSWDIDEIAA